MVFREPGDVISERYEVQACVGRGAMGAVYLVKDQHLPGARWALKELVPGEVPERERAMTVELFEREGDLLQALSHPGLPRVIDRFTDDNGCLCIVMEYIPGGPLDDVLAAIHRPLLPIEAVPIGLQATHVLEYLHSQDPPIIFRDLKPSNLMLTPEGRIYVIDFGIARRFSQEKSKDTQELGTPGFCAPEQYGHGQTTPRSDIYALGTTLYHLLTRLDPQTLNFKFPPVSDVQPAPKALEVALQKCLQLNPEDRYTSAVELRTALEEALTEVV